MEGEFAVNEEVHVGFLERHSTVLGDPQARVGVLGVRDQKRLQRHTIRVITYELHAIQLITYALPKKLFNTQEPQLISFPV